MLDNAGIGSAVGTTCPNCGAPVRSLGAKKCEYCGPPAAPAPAPPPQDVIYTQDGLQIPETELELPYAGQYFIRVRATNEKGKTQDAFDYYVTDDGKQYGMRCIYVTEDGLIEEDIYEE